MYVTVIVSTMRSFLLGVYMQQKTHVQNSGNNNKYIQQFIYTCDCFKNKYTQTRKLKIDKVHTCILQISVIISLF